MSMIRKLMKPKPYEKILMSNFYCIGQRWVYNGEKPVTATGSTAIDLIGSVPFNPDKQTFILEATAGNLQSAVNLTQDILDLGTDKPDSISRTKWTTNSWAISKLLHNYINVATHRILTTVNGSSARAEFIGEDKIAMSFRIAINSNGVVVCGHIYPDERDDGTGPATATESSTLQYLLAEMKANQHIQFGSIEGKTGFTGIYNKASIIDKKFSLKEMKNLTKLPN